MRWCEKEALSDAQASPVLLLKLLTTIHKRKLQKSTTRSLEVLEDLIEYFHVVIDFMMPGSITEKIAMAAKKRWVHDWHWQTNELTHRICFEVV